jgi:hypothetical protein
MPVARTWTAAQDETIRNMRAVGSTWAAIANALQMSRNIVIERGRRLNAEWIQSKEPLHVKTSQGPNRAPYPPGHPATWSLLTNMEFPR